MRKPKAGKKGDLYYIKFKDPMGVGAMVVSYKGIKQGLLFYKILAAVCPENYMGNLDGGETTSPKWDLVQECKKITVKDLPLYVYMNSKAPKFLELLGGIG